MVVWVDASLNGFADSGPVPAELIVVPGWPDRLSIVRALRGMNCRVIVERDESDLALGRVASREWGEVIWGATGPAVRPTDLAGRLPRDGPRTCAQLASRVDLFESSRSPRGITYERRRKREDAPRNRRRG